jgi:hypothetical protein
LAGPVFGQSTFPRAGWDTLLSQAGHGVQGRVTIVDERTLRLTNFSYDGRAPDMFVYLGTSLDREAFRANGIRIGPLLARAYTNETLVVQLPVGQTLEGWTAVCIWCEFVRSNYGWGTFAPPLRPSLSATPRASGVELKIVGESGQKYWLQRKDEMVGSGEWQNQVLLTNLTGTIRYTNAVSPGQANLFWRALRD